jgi:hypothetical protein
MLFALFIYNIGALTVHIEFLWRDIETGERRAFSESFQPFRAEPHTLILYLSCNTISKKNVIWFNNKKKDTGNPIWYLNSSSGKGHGLIAVLG